MVLVEPVKQRVLRDKWALELTKIVKLADDLLLQTNVTAESINQLHRSGDKSAESLSNGDAEYIQLLPEPDVTNKDDVTLYELLVSKYETVQSQWLEMRIKLASKLATLPQPSASASTASRTSVNVKKPDRPAVDLETSETQWLFFLDEWRVYRKKANLSSTDDIVDELRSCCTLELRQAMFNMVGPDRLSNIDEQELLAEIKKVAVRGKNIAVHRNEFHGLKQANSQKLQDFVSTLRAKSEHCKFSVVCTNHACQNEVSYAQAMISDQMIVGVYDKDIQADVLSKATTLDTFEKKFDHMQCMELGKEAKSALGTNSPPESLIGAQKTPYQRMKYGKPNHTPESMQGRTTPTRQNQSRCCQGCGGPLHGKTPREHTTNKKLKCPAKDHSCEYCSKIGHYGAVCRNELKQQSQPHAAVEQPEVGHFFAYESAASSPADTATADHNGDTVIPHMEWNGNEFQPAPPTPSPRTKVEVTVLDQCHKDFGRKLPWCRKQEPNRPRVIDVITDTGAQTCCAGPEMLEQLNMPRGYLVPTSHLSVGIDRKSLNIMGVALVAFKRGDVTAYHPLYITRGCQGLYLSLKAQKDLGILGQSYPDNVTSTQAATREYSKEEQCNCPRRQKPPPKPSEIPFPPTPENRGKIEQWIRDRYKSSAFNVCEHQPLPEMTGSPLDMHFEPGVKPTAFHTPIPVPHYWKSKVKADLDRDVRIGTIERVPQGTPTIWCARMVVVAKHDNSPRRTIDLQPLNKATLRETHHTPTPYNQASVVPPRKKKTVLDAWNGYHSLGLSPRSRDYTTFITEWGRYRCLRAPQGFHAAGDAYTRRFDDITMDIQRKSKVVDDTLLWDDDIETAFWHTLEYLDLCASNGVVFNPKKFHFAEDVVDFAGFTITEDGLRPMQSVLSAIMDFPTPTNISGMRSWFGLLNQISYALALSEKLEPFRDLLKPKKQWYWDDTLDQLFQFTKLEVVKQIEEGVKSFETSRPTCLATDWSKTGMGFFLLQKHCTCPMTEAPNCCQGGWKLVMAGSRFTNDAEARYAPVEGEALAVVHALEKARMFVLGCPDLTIATDHKPLVKLLGDRSLEQIHNPRLLNLKEKTLRYKFSIKHVPGGWHVGPDALSRFPTAEAMASTSCQNATACHTVNMESSPRQNPALDHCGEADEYELERYVEASVMASFQGDGLTEGIRAVTWDRVKQAASVDTVSRSLMQTINNGFPSEKKMLPQILQPYWNMRDQLYSIDGVPVVGTRTVVPVSLREEVLDNLHSAHQGVSGMRARARTSVYWPGIKLAIDKRRSQCRACDRMTPSAPAQPLIQHRTPEYPYQLTVADYFHHMGNKYLVYADRYTGNLVIVQTTNDSGGRTLISHLRTLFSDWGTPDEFSTDGGPPFNSFEVKNFLRRWGVNSNLSSAYYPQSNGRAELAVKTAKRLITDNTGPNGRLNTDRLVAALLQYRNTPMQDIGLSPAQMLFGRNLRDSIPVHKQALLVRPEWRMIAEDREIALAKRNLRSRERYNLHTRDLPSLRTGDKVQVQNQTGSKPKRWDKTGTIVETNGNRQYSIRMDGSGRVTLRNRRFMRQIQPMYTDLPMPEIIDRSINELRPEPNIEQHVDDLNLNELPQPEVGEVDLLPEPASVDAPSPRKVPDVLRTQPINSILLPLRTNPAIIPDMVHVRQSSRARKPRRDLSPNMRGQTHDVTERP